MAITVDLLGAWGPRAGRSTASGMTRRNEAFP